MKKPMVAVVLSVLLTAASVQATTATLIGIKFGDQPVTSTVDAYWPQSTAHWNQVSATNTFPVNTGFVDETGAAVTSGLSVVCVGNGNVLKNGDAFEAEVQPNWTPWPGPNIPGNVSPVGALAYGGLGTAREGGAQITISGIPAGSHVAILESWLNCSATWDMIQPGDLAHHVILWGPTEGSTSLYVDPGTGLQTFYWQRAADSSYWDHSNTVAYAVQILVPGVPEPAMTASVAGPLDLGPLGVSTASTVTTVTLSSNGDPGTTVKITDASVAGAGFGFSSTPGATPVSVLAGANAQYGIQLAAQTVPGHYTGTATFVTDIAEGAGFKTFTYDLSADVIAHAGDVNGDGQVSLLDYNIIKANFGNSYESGNHWNDGDVNGDQQVGLLDFNIVKAHFGHTTGDGAAVTAVPEPATLSLLALAGLAALRRRR